MSPHQTPTPTPTPALTLTPTPSPTLTPTLTLTLTLAQVLVVRPPHAATRSMGEAALLGPPVCQRCGRTCFTEPAEPETGTENCDYCARLLCWACAQMCGACHETVCSSVLWGSCPCRCNVRRTESTHCNVAQSDEDKHLIMPVLDSSTVTRPWTTSLVPSTHREGPNPRICPGLCQWFGPECTGKCDLEFDHLDTVHICAPCFGIDEGFVDIIDEGSVSQCSFFMNASMSQWIST